MTPIELLQQFTNDVYLTIKNRFYDDLTTSDGQTYMQQIVSWANHYIGELELKADWNFVLTVNYNLGTAPIAGNTTMDFDSDVRKLVVDEDRPLQILQDGSPVSTWAVVTPSDITNPVVRHTEDMVTVVGNNPSQIVFSRPLKDTEANGLVQADAIMPIPRFLFNTTTGQINVDALNVVTPPELLILGVAKNATLPDIVKGAISPNYVQKHDQMLSDAIADNASSSVARQVKRDSYAYVHGVY